MQKLWHNPQRFKTSQHNDDQKGSRQHMRVPRGQGLSVHLPRPGDLEGVPLHPLYQQGHRQVANEVINRLLQALLHPGSEQVYMG